MNAAKIANANKMHAGIVIIGAGAAGLSAAAAAVENGVRDILVLERNATPGGNALFPEGIFAAESHIQKRFGIEARRDELFKAAMSFAHWKTNPLLVRTLINRSGDTISWLEDKGVKFDSVIMHYPNQVPTVFHTVKPPERTGAAVVRALYQYCRDMGVKFIWKARAMSLVRSPIGAVNGLTANIQGKETDINARCVIIATGGFAGNNALLKKYVPLFNDKEIRRAGMPHKGDGLQMATKAGAALDGMATLEMAGPSYTGPILLSPFAHRPQTIWVNAGGDRFVDETVFFVFSEAANSVWRQPGKISYTLFDENIKQQIMRDGLDPHEKITLGKLTPGWSDSVEEQFRDQTKKDTIMIGKSWAKIAAWIGVTPEKLRQTIDTYNTFCDKGYDDDFAKNRYYLTPLTTPPYYAMKCGITLIATHGGIKINHRTEVLDCIGTSIPGLYAAGVETGGTDSDTYNVILSGHSFGFSINTGRIAGEETAGYIKNTDHSTAVLQGK